MVDHPGGSAPLFEPRSGESWRDPFPMYKALRDHDPVHRFENSRGEFWALSRFKDVFAAAIDNAISGDGIVSHPPE